MSNIQVRINPETKKAAQRVLKQLDMDMSTAVKVYLRQLIIHRGIPFKLLTENSLTPAQESELLRLAGESAAGRNVSEAMSPKEAIAHLKWLGRSSQVRPRVASLKKSFAVRG